MAAFTYMLLTIWVAKVYVIGRAIFWLRRNGADYRSRIEALGHDADPVAFYELLDVYKDAQFLPFGLLDYRARRAAIASSSNLLRLVARLFADFLFRGNWLAVITFFFLFGQSVYRTPGATFSNAFGWWPMFILAVMPLFAVLALCIESITAYAKLRSYAYAFAMRRPSQHKYFDELALVLGILLRAILASATAVYVSTVFHCAFKGDALIHADPGNVGEHLLLLVQSVYFSVVTIATVGYGDIVPANIWGELIALLTVLVSFSLLTFVLTSLSAISSDQLGRRTNGS